MTYNNIDNPVVWVHELPSSCSECHEPLTDKSFTSKKGEHWDKVICDNCGIQWIKSKPKGKSVKQPQSNEVMDALRAIWKKLDEIETKLVDKAMELEDIKTAIKK